jgi:uncharacterized membrane protein YkvA (DUF1232 family)
MAENVTKTKKSFFKRNMVLILTILYILWPIDIIPDALVTLLGPAVAIDDLAVLLFAVVSKILEYMKKQSPELEKEEKETVLAE